MSSIIMALNAAYDVREIRPWWRRRLVALCLTVGFSLIILVALLLVVFGDRIGAAAANRFGPG